MKILDLMVFAILGVGLVSTVAVGNFIAAGAYALSLLLFYACRKEQGKVEALRVKQKNQMQALVETIVNLKKPLREGQIRVFEGGWDIVWFDVPVPGFLKSDCLVNPPGHIWTEEQKQKLMNNPNKPFCGEDCCHYIYVDQKETENDGK